MSAAPRPESLTRLEQEVGVLVRRIRRVIAERAGAVHPELQHALIDALALGSSAGPS